MFVGLNPYKLIIYKLKMAATNIIPIGDHCAAAILLKDLGLRNASYPFDWVVCHEQVKDTNIFLNIQYIRALNSTNARQIACEFVGDADRSQERVNSKNNIWFPHDEPQTMIEKYTRRFARLFSDLQAHTNIFVMVTRCYFISQEQFDAIMETLLGFKKGNRILFFSGIDHPYLNDEKYKECIAFVYIHYDVDKLFDYDYCSSK
jgi:hypothetical protein